MSKFIEVQNETSFRHVNLDDVQMFYYSPKGLQVVLRDGSKYWVSESDLRIKTPIDPNSVKVYEFVVEVVDEAIHSEVQAVFIGPATHQVEDVLSGGTHYIADFPNTEDCCMSWDCDTASLDKDTFFNSRVYQFSDGTFFIAENGFPGANGKLYAVPLRSIEEVKERLRRECQKALTEHLARKKHEQSMAVEV